MTIMEHLVQDSAQTTEIIGRLAKLDGQINRSELRMMIAKMLKSTGRMVKFY